MMSLGVFSSSSQNGLSGAGMAQQLCNGLPHDDPRFDSRWERCKNRASRPSQGTINGGTVSKWPCCLWDAKHNQPTSQIGLKVVSHPFDSSHPQQIGLKAVSSWISYGPQWLWNQFESWNRFIVVMRTIELVWQSLMGILLQCIIGKVQTWLRPPMSSVVLHCCLRKSGTVILAYYRWASHIVRIIVLH